MQRTQFYLCGWLTLAMSAELLTAHPTFTRYFIVTTPFLAILAVPGLLAIDWQFFHPDRPFWPVLAVAVLLSLGLTQGLYEHRDSTSWKDMEKLAQKVDQVTPRNAPLFADELVYFLLRRPPPSGMEFAYAHNLELPPARAALLHIVSNADLKRQSRRPNLCAPSKLATITSLSTRSSLPDLYVHKEDIEDCCVIFLAAKVTRPVNFPRKRLNLHDKEIA